jgi:hypothetical protein
MIHSGIAYDDAAYAVDQALERAAAADATGVLAQVTGAVRLLDGTPYAGLRWEVSRFGADAVLAARAGDFERSRDFLVLLGHVVEDARKLSVAPVPN